MKQKKSHEVLQICPLIDSVWKEANVDTIVDIGAGQGFISYVRDPLLWLLWYSIWHHSTNTRSMA